MVFAPNDIYSNLANRGSLPKIGFAQILYNCWTDKVTKFDSNSFYNWEQDNQPLYDLEERTYYNWERNGFPTSSHTLVGINLVVSADAPDSVIGCNKNIFRTVSAAVNAIPEYIDTPVLVEVCNFGNLGELVIENKRFGPNGSIEIINRAFAEGEPIASATNVLNFPAGEVFYNYTDGITSDYLVSSLEGLSPNSNEPGFNTTVQGQIRDVSSIILGSRVVSSTSADTRLNGQLSLFTTTVQNLCRNRLTAAIWDKNSIYSVAQYPYNDATLKITPYELNADPKDQISTHDVVPRSFDAGLTVLNATNVLAYWNRFTKIKISNCDSGTRNSGYIFIRNFYVDGRATSTDYGFEISNSSKIFLENCTASRCALAGFYFNNSKINIARGLVSYRNYTPSATGQSRLSGDWNTKKYRNVYESGYYLEGKGCGVLSVNSNINFFNTKFIENVFWNTDFAGYISIPDPNDIEVSAFVPYYGSNVILNFSRNDYGILMINSTFDGGNLDKYSTRKYLSYVSLNSNLNTEAGIKLINSDWNFDGRTEVYGNNYGFVAENSNVAFDLFEAAGNWNTGLVLDNSKLIYNKNLDFYTTIPAGRNLWFNSNGQNILMKSSQLMPRLTFNMPSRFSELTFENNLGTENPDLFADSYLPSIELINSKAILVHPRISGSFTYQEPLKGVVAVKSNSELILKGSKEYATRVFGPTSFLSQKYRVGLYASDNSKIRLEGPSVIAQFGVDALAENNSIIEIGPHKNSNNAGIDVSGFNLNDKDNHTMVELHSTRACLIVDKNSVLDIRDIGNYELNWAGRANGTAALALTPNYNTITGNYFSNYVSGGFIQFYPNVNGDSYYPTNPGINSVVTGTVVSQNNFQNGTYAKYFLKNVFGQPNVESNYSEVTTGGMCVRALNNSVVNVLNTNFLTGWWNASGIIYDINGFDTVALCNRLFIWNIADNSQINAALVSVSSAHPVDVGYHGPRGVWTTSSMQITGTYFELSNAPNSTPDTSTISVLDYFGACSSLGTSSLNIGFSSFNNFGPFRLYFSTDPACNWLYNASIGSTARGLAPQVYAQGYQLPSNFAFSGIASGTHMSLLKRPEGATTGGYITSGFYYGSEMLYAPFTQRAVLDESAANLFANAKHCSVGKSKLGKVTAINLPWTNIWYGEIAGNALKDAGRGFKSTNLFDLSRDD